MSQDGKNTTVVLDCGCVIRLDYPLLPGDIDLWGWICVEHPGARTARTIRRDLHTAISL